jgi:hypothetical protein
MSGSSPDNYSSYEDSSSPALTPRLLSIIFDANAHARGAEYLDLMRVEVDAQLGKLCARHRRFAPTISSPMFSQLPRSPLPPSTPSVNSAWGEVRGS